LTRSSAGGSVPVAVGFPLGCCARFPFSGVPRWAGLAAPGCARFQLPIGFYSAEFGESEQVAEVRKMADELAGRGSWWPSWARTATTAARTVLQEIALRLGHDAA